MSKVDTLNWKEFDKKEDRRRVKKLKKRKARKEIKNKMLN